VKGSRGGLHHEPGVEALAVTPRVHDDLRLDINDLKTVILSVGQRELGEGKICVQECAGHRRRRTWEAQNGGSQGRGSQGEARSDGKLGRDPMKRLQVFTGEGATLACVWVRLEFDCDFQVTSLVCLTRSRSS
jgi:hypothetical protein